MKYYFYTLNSGRKKIEMESLIEKKKKMNDDLKKL